MERQPKNLNAELAELHSADQKDREAWDSHDETRLGRDRARMKRAREIYEKRDLLTPEALFHLAILFQHGEDPEDYVKAMELAKASEEGGYEPGAWLAAAAEDRHLLSIGQKQKWGTQFRSEDGKHEVLDMLTDEESGITDEMRKEKGVLPPEEVIRQLAEMDRKPKGE